MSYILLLIAFNGNITTSVYQSPIQCESALFEATDLCKMKEIKVAKCINIEK